jgi:hypothetical protein
MMTERRPQWRKSTYSNGSSSCIETTALLGAIAVRDSKDPAGPQLGIPVAAWQAFTHRFQTDTGPRRNASLLADGCWRISDADR